MKGWRTIAFSGALILLGALETTNIADAVPDAYDGIALALVGLVTAVLRFVTTTPVGKR